MTAVFDDDIDGEPLGASEILQRELTKALDELPGVSEAWDEFAPAVASAHVVNQAPTQEVDVDDVDALLEDALATATGAPQVQGALAKSRADKKQKNVRREEEWEQFRQESRRHRRSSRSRSRSRSRDRERSRRRSRSRRRRRSRSNRRRSRSKQRSCSRSRSRRKRSCSRRKRSCSRSWSRRHTSASVALPAVQLLDRLKTDLELAKARAAAKAEEDARANASAAAASAATNFQSFLEMRSRAAVMPVAAQPAPAPARRARAAVAEPAVILNGNDLTALPPVVGSTSIIQIARPGATTGKWKEKKKKKKDKHGAAVVHHELRDLKMETNSGTLAPSELRDLLTPADALRRLRELHESLPPEVRRRTSGEPMTAAAAASASIAAATASVLPAGYYLIDPGPPARLPASLTPPELDLELDGEELTSGDELTDDGEVAPGREMELKATEEVTVLAVASASVRRKAKRKADDEFIVLDRIRTDRRHIDDSDI